jgi:hypothetical protein
VTPECSRLFPSVITRSESLGNLPPPPRPTQTTSCHSETSPPLSPVVVSSPGNSAFRRMHDGLSKFMAWRSRDAMTVRRAEWGSARSSGFSGQEAQHETIAVVCNIFVFPVSDG